MTVYLRNARAAWRSPGSDRRIRALVFEPAGVLYDNTSRRRWLWQLVTQPGARPSYGEFFRPWDSDFLPRAQRGEISYLDALREFLTLLGLAAAHRDEVVAAMSWKDQPLEAGPEALPGMARVLGRLSAAGVVLAVLGDCPLRGEELKSQLDGMGIGGLMAAVVTSRDLHSIKPAVENYQAIAAALKLRAEELAIVSSRPDDLRGAGNLGWSTIRFGLAHDPQSDLAVISPIQLLDAVMCCSAGLKLSAG